MAIKLPIATTTDQRMGFIFFKLMQLSGIVNRSTDTDIIVDLTDARFLNAVYLSGLFSLMRGWQREGKNVSIKSSHARLNSYLNTICFEKGFVLDDGPNSIRYLESFLRKQYTPIVSFPTTGIAREESVSTLISIIVNQTGVAGQYEIAIRYLLSELSNNIKDHSGAQFGTIMAQTYKSLGFIDFTLSDNGMGVFNSYRNSPKFHPSNESEAVEMAVSGKSTKDLPESRGYGISTSREMIAKGMGGTFLLWSGSTFFAQNREIRQTAAADTDAYYQGCWIAMRIPIQPLAPFNFYDFVE